MAVTISKSTGELLTVKVELDLTLPTWTPRRKKNLVKFLRNRVFVQSYRGVAEIAWNLIKESNCPMYRWGTCYNVPKTPELLEVYRSAIGMALLAHVPDHSGYQRRDYTQEHLEDYRAIVEAGNIPGSTYYFEKYTQPIKDYVASLPVPQKIIKLADDIESGKLTKITIDWDANA
jgi:hypothetical protein